MTQTAALPLWILFLGGGGIVLGLATLGYRVIRTIGTKITMLTPTMGFCVELAAAATVVLASRTGLPVSTTQIVVGGVIGVGLARGIGAIDLRVVGGVFASLAGHPPRLRRAVGAVFLYFEGDVWLRGGAPWRKKPLT